MDADPRILNRQLRQRLEALARAGLDRLPLGPLLPSLPPRGEVLKANVVQSPPPVESVATIEHRERPPEERPKAPLAPSRRSAEAPSRPPTVPSVVGSLFDEVPIDGPVVPPEERFEALRVIAEEVAGCTRCEILAASRTRTVPGEGNPVARLMFVGEGPGQTEDETGRPFVGKAGRLLDDMISKGMGLRREDVFIANIVKCRPPGNRDPEPAEVRNCIGYLERQIAIIRPEFLCLLGKPAAQTLLSTSMPMGRLRGKWQRYKGIPTIATWHPAYLLRNPSAKKETWEDLQMLMKAMGLPISRRGEQ